jgi:hypothetical protein
MRATTAVLVLVLATGGSAGATPAWQRTEMREPCARADVFRSPFFGDLHIHTRFSADAYIFGTRVAPRDAYAFAKGAAIPFADDDEAQTRSAQIDRPLDFAAVTDHSEFFGEVRLCDDVASPLYDDPMCQLLRRADSPEDQGQATVSWLFPAGISMTHHHAFCNDPGIDCGAAAASVWQDVQAAAEEAYDRTAACSFTSLLGYEYTASPIGRHLHRNIIFRNDRVPPGVSSYIETAAGGIPQGFWSAIETTCLHAGTGCEAVIIPHNSNLSAGRQFFDPADGAEALRRQTLEPLVEIHQIKGNSECRFDRLAGAGAGTADELCTFEQQLVAHQLPGTPPPAIDEYPQRNLVRNALKDGLKFEDQIGANPFRMGFIGSTDNHDGAAGSVAESGWAGGQGNNDSSPARLIGDNLRTNPGGLAVVWAEENSRDAIFTGLARRETYATSGTRPIVRFFGGDLAPVVCGAPSFVHDAYASGTPMGGEIGPVRGRRSPRFAVWAVKDAGTANTPGTDLQRVQIVKGWVDKNGETHEQVFDVAGDAQNGADVDPATCAPRGAGARELCTVWRDPTFSRDERAFYYARVVENPTCRWSTRVCKAAGVDPLSPDCATQAAAAPAAFADCCRGTATDPFLDPLVQERAWTSPVWYQPDGIARVRAKLRFGTTPGTDRLSLRLALGRVPKAYDPARNDLQLRIVDDDEVLALTIPAGTRLGRATRVALDRPAGAFAKVARHGRDLRLVTEPIDLARADRDDHMVTVSLAGGTWRASHTRLWVATGDRLMPGGR